MSIFRRFRLEFGSRLGIKTRLLVMAEGSTLMSESETDQTLKHSDLNIRGPKIK